MQAAAPRPVPMSAQASPAGAAVARRRRPSPTRAAMARRMQESKHGVPHFYLAAEAEVSALELDRATRNGGDVRRHLTLTAYIVAAVGRALADLPDANTVWADGELLTYATADVGIAVDAPQGLYAPLLRDAGAKSLDAIARESRALAERARAGTLAADDMTGGAITVSNAGMHNVTWMSPIIAPGQSAILGVASVRQVFRPDPKAGPRCAGKWGSSSLRITACSMACPRSRCSTASSSTCSLRSGWSIRDPGSARDGRPPAVRSVGPARLRHGRRLRAGAGNCPRPRGSRCRSGGERHQRRSRRRDGSRHRGRRRTGRAPAHRRHPQGRRGGPRADRQRRARRPRLRVQQRRHPKDRQAGGSERAGLACGARCRLDRCIPVQPDGGPLHDRAWRRQDRQHRLDCRHGGELGPRLFDGEGRRGSSSPACSPIGGRSTRST